MLDNISSLAIKAGQNKCANGFSKVLEFQMSLRGEYFCEL
jgi:hypothetical protein